MLWSILHLANCTLGNCTLGQLVNRNLINRYSVLVIRITCNVTCIHACAIAFRPRVQLNFDLHTSLGSLDATLTQFGRSYISLDDPNLANLIHTCAIQEADYCGAGIAKMYNSTCVHQYRSRAKSGHPPLSYC